MDYLGVLYFVSPLIILVWAKIKLKIKLFRVFLLSFLPVLLISTILFIYAFISTVDLSGSINIFLMTIFYGYIFSFPIFISYALLVKVLYKYGNDITTSATLGSLFVLFLVVIFSGHISSLLFPTVIIISSFISVLIEDKIFNSNLNKLQAIKEG